MHVVDDATVTSQYDVMIPHWGNGIDTQFRDDVMLARATGCISPIGCHLEPKQHALQSTQQGLEAFNAEVTILA